MAITYQNTKDAVRATSGLDLLAGIWLIAAPFMLGFSTSMTAMWNSVIVGMIIAVLAASRLPEDGTKIAWPSWTNVAVGIWLIASPFVLGFSGLTVAMWSSVITGIVVAVLAAISGSVTQQYRQDRY